MDRETRIAGLRNACGCKEGSAALVLAVGAYLLWPVLFPDAETTWGKVLVGVAIALGSAVVGKLLGLLVAQVRLRRLLRTPA